MSNTKYATYMIYVLDDTNNVVTKKEICESRRKAKGVADSFLVEECVKNAKVRKVWLVERCILGDGEIVYVKGKGDLRVELKEKGVL